LAGALRVSYESDFEPHKEALRVAGSTGRRRSRLDLLGSIVIGLMRPAEALRSSRQIEAALVPVWRDKETLAVLRMIAGAFYESMELEVAHVPYEQR
jgi:hypothetical protein